MHCYKALNFFGVVYVVLFFLIGSLQPVFASEITDGLKATINSVMEVVKDKRYKDVIKARRAAMRKIIDLKFSYRQMSMRSLAQHWNKLNAKEQEEFIHLFGRLLENSYASKIESYSDEVIKYTEEMVKGKYALVKTEIERVDGTFNVDYKLVLENESWQVFDFVIEGVSMIKNYRSQFSRIIKKESFETLKKKMTEKIEGIEGGI